MVDRQDIDALLIGALYSELTPADEARLSVHLESHPADRVVLDGLNRARSVVRESRILEVQLDPPQAVSALLLQEAARRAPRRVDSDRKSWLQRFFGSFLAHPAMAAATMFVVVIGVAGTVYMTRGDQLAEQTVATDRTRDVDEAAPTAASTAAGQGGVLELEKAQKDEKAFKYGEAADKAPAADTTTAYPVQLDDRVGGKKDAAEHQDATRRKLELAAGSGSDLRYHAGTPAPRTPPAARPDPRNGIIINPAEAPPPKDLDADRSGALNGMTTADPSSETRAQTGTGAGDAMRSPTAKPADAQKPTVVARPQPTGGDNNAPSGRNAAPAPPPVASTAPGRTVAADPAKGEVAKEGKEERRHVDEDLVWARAQLDQAVAYMKQKDCTAVARVMLDINKRAPDFYAQNVANHRELAACRSYADNARERDAEQNQKSRAPKKANMKEADHAAPAPAHAP